MLNSTNVHGFSCRQFLPVCRLLHTLTASTALTREKWRGRMKRFTLDKLPRRVLQELDVERAFLASRAVIAAERLTVFRLLHKKRLTASQIAARLHLDPDATLRLLTLLRALGLLSLAGKTYSNTRLADKYFIRERSVYWTKQYSREGVETFQNAAKMEELIAARVPEPSVQKGKKPGYVKMMEQDPDRARDFTLMLYYYHQEEAEKLAKAVDLRPYHAVLDVGGGSGVMSIAMVKRHPHLRACVFDIEPVCRVARQIINENGMSQKITAQGGDFSAGLPTGYDVIMFCDLGPIRDELLSLAFDALPVDGLLVIAADLPSEDKTRPIEQPLERLVAPSYGWETRRELTSALKAHGFRRIRYRPVCGNYGVITAVKRTGR